MNSRHKISIIVAVFLLILGWREYSRYSERKAMEESYTSTISFLDTEKKELKSSLDLKVADNFIMKQNLMSEKSAKELLRKEVVGYKNISAYLKGELVTAVKHVEASYSDDTDTFDDVSINDSNYIHKDEVEAKFVRFPKEFSHKDEWMRFNGVVGKESVVLDSLEMINKFDAIIGRKKSEKRFSWARKKEPVVSLKSYNPYTKIVYVNNVIIENKKTKAANIMLSKPAMILYGIIGGSVFLN